jgi:23S rRNA (cytidine1920-2'-O)/16S rRNA (cytidine1409-2'-O)-methyltransferase
MPKQAINPLKINNTIISSQKVFIGRAGEKLNFALDKFKISVKGRICADFGSSIGGFVDCLLQHGASKVYAVETGYGVLGWKLRNDSRVVVMERTNAMHVGLPQKADFVSIDTSWTKQEKIIPNALKNLKEKGSIIALIKPHYESGRINLTEKEALAVAENVVKKIKQTGLRIKGPILSPVKGKSGKNNEFLICLDTA